jgi:hypothetical protein
MVGTLTLCPPLRPINVIASVAKQSISQRRRSARWIASSHPPSPEGGLRRTRVLLAMTLWEFCVCSNSRCASAFSRHDLPEACVSLSLQREGAGNAGCALHPRSRVQNGQKKTHTSIQVQRRQSDIPCAMALRLTSRSPRRIGLCCLRRLRIAGSSAPGRADLPSADLTPTAEASGPHDFTVRFPSTPKASTG